MLLCASGLSSEAPWAKEDARKNVHQQPLLTTPPCLIPPVSPHSVPFLLCFVLLLLTCSTVLLFSCSPVLLFTCSTVLLFWRLRTPSPVSRYVNTSLRPYQLYHTISRLYPINYLTYLAIPSTVKTYNMASFGNFRCVQTAQRLSSLQTQRGSE